ncbi:MAG: NAD(+)/NADH kinase [Candidatus Omnitrophota bacterium]|jgi:NAD+ kinase|nr:MAG: NAD(+)/NADH kinase [Candidatus Omnitrophota bacterium]
MPNATLPPLKKVLILYNPEKMRARETGQQAQELLNHAGVATRFVEYKTPEKRRSCDESIGSMAEDCDVVLVLGGDGTILGVAREIARSRRPLLGINLGGFGFLTSGAIHELEETLACLISGNYNIVNRYFLKAWVKRPTANGEEGVFESLALNEALVTLNHPGRLLNVWLGEGNEPTLAYRGDGLIIATPTGSTGHSLSAGGPILEPHLAALIITPVSPHSLFNRPMVIDGERELCIQFQENTSELLLILDGQIRSSLNATDRVHIRRSRQTLPTIFLPNRSFSSVLRYKFNLGE